MNHLDNTESVIPAEQQIPAANVIAQVDVTTLLPEGKTPKSKTTSAKSKVDKGPSKIDMAYKLVEENFNKAKDGTALPRAKVIEQMMTNLGISQPHASTYYQTSVTKYKAANNGAAPQLPTAHVK